MTMEKELNQTTDDWTGKAPDLLIEHILVDFHEPLNQELPRLEALAKKVHQEHGDKEPAMLGGVLNTFSALKNELIQHMAKEEQVLFPMIQSGSGMMAGGPISAMEEEHSNAKNALRHLRDLTRNYAVPEGAGEDWRALWEGLEAFEASLHQHIHLENDILFPKVLGGI